MRVECKVGDIVDEQVDVLVSTGNVQLNMSGGVNGEILRRGGKTIQKELHQYLKDHNIGYVEPGTVLQVNSGPILAKYLLYAVAINAWYESTIELVCHTIVEVLQKSCELDAKTVALPAMATGYGNLTINQFGKALNKALKKDYPGIEEIRIVLRTKETVEIVESLLD